jgi:hypothetical protein
MRGMFRTGVLVVAGLVGGGVGYVAADGTGGGGTAQPNQNDCGSINCVGTVSGVQTGSNPPQGCSCVLNGVGFVCGCVYTGVPTDNCVLSGVSAYCIGTVQGNPNVNCQKSYPSC